MGNRAKILAFAGSAREESFNKKLIRNAVQGAEDAGASVTLIDLRDFPLPIFDQDAEAIHGLPENAVRLKALMREHNGLLIASPEYNSSISPLLKNTIDWISRTEREDEPMLECYIGKIAAIMAASPGALGGLRGLVTVRSILSNINVLVLPQQVTVPEAHQAFNDDGRLADPKKQAAVESLGRELAAVVAKLRG
ncbi:MAG: NAD(P)H-dependent oxidoreductase [Chlamydiia bacterium]|nr:NAD(P)H-dependent oxidoreductase [Chlamydiia bacterium]